MILEALATFALMFALDFAWAGYIKAVADGQAMRAAVLASALMAITGAITLSYVNNPWMLIPVALGAFAGTYASVRILGGRNEKA